MAQSKTTPKKKAAPPLELEGDAARGEQYLMKWLDPRRADRESQRLLTMPVEDVLQALADIDTAREHAQGVFKAIQGLRPDVKLPPRKSAT